MRQKTTWIESVFPDKTVNPCKMTKIIKFFENENLTITLKHEQAEAQVKFLEMPMSSALEGTR